MTSINAENVAKEVLETIGKGKKVKLGKIIKKNGYAQNTADNPKLVTETESFKSVINPIVEKWAKERDRLTNELLTRDLSKERYDSVIKSIDLFTKNIQLLSGGNTGKIAIDDGLIQEQKDKLLGLL